MTNKNEKPCLTCPIVENSCDCNASKCGAWKKWWLGKWAEIHEYGERKDNGKK